MTRDIIFKRIPQMNGSSRSFRILADGLEIDFLEAGVSQKIVNVPLGTKYLQVYMRPYHRSAKLYLSEEDEAVLYYIGFVYTNDFQTFLPTSLKILSEEHFNALSKPKQWPRLLTNSLLATILLGLISGGLLIAAALISIDDELGFLLLLFGFSAIGGCYSSYCFNRPKASSTFPYQKPFWDAGSLMFLILFLEPFEILSKIACIVFLALLILGAINLKFGIENRK